MRSYRQSPSLGTPLKEQGSVALRPGQGGRGGGRARARQGGSHDPTSEAWGRARGPERGHRTQPGLPCPGLRGALPLGPQIAGSSLEL